MIRRTRIEVTFLVEGPCDKFNDDAHTLRELEEIIKSSKHEIEFVKHGHNTHVPIIIIRDNRP